MPRTLLRRTLAAMGILLVAAHALLAAREGLSNLYAHIAHREVAPAATGPGKALAAPSARALRNLEASLRYSPRNAWALEMMGTEQLRRARGYTQPIDAFNQRTAALSAKGFFHKALLERPTVPWVWANLALAKLQLREIDVELFQILRWADELGPWEPYVQNVVIEASLISWPRLEPTQREAVVRTMSRGAQRDPGNIAQIAKNFNRLDLLCAINLEEALLGSTCGPGAPKLKKNNRVIRHESILH